MPRDLLPARAVPSGAVVGARVAGASRPTALPLTPNSATGGQRPGSPPMMTVTDIRQYFYCPRIVFYRLCQPLRRPVTYKMREGKLAQDRAADLEQQRSLAAYGLASGERHFNVSVRSGALGLQGIVDMVIVTGEEVIPVEFKNTTQRLARNHTYQLAAHALLVEEHWQRPVQRGFVYRLPLKSATEVPLNRSSRQAVLGALAALRRMVALEQLPEPTSRLGRCVECEYRRFCGDID